MKTEERGKKRKTRKRCLFLSSLSPLCGKELESDEKGGRKEGKRKRKKVKQKSLSCKNVSDESLFLIPILFNLHFFLFLFPVPSLLQSHMPVAFGRLLLFL